MDLKAIQAKLARITDLRRNLMNLTDAFESGSAVTKPAVAQTIGICVIELRVEMDEYLLLINTDSGASVHVMHQASTVRQ